MNIGATIKRAPRWTWYTVGGITIGTVGLKLWRHRAATPADQAATDGSTAGDTLSGSTQPGTTGSSPPGVIVPPIITGGDGGSASDLGAAFGGLVSGYLDDLTNLVGVVVTGDQGTIGQLIGQQGETYDSILSMIAGAGIAPKPVAQVPTPVSVTVRPPAVPPRPTAHRPKPTVHGPAKTKNYTVKKGDTLGAIAQRFGTSVAHLQTINHIQNPNRINAGATIKVPA